MTTLDSQQVSPPAEAVVGRLGPTGVLVLAAWCGLAGGEFEVAGRILMGALVSTRRMYELTRHFVWLGPLINLLLFLCVAGLLVLVDAALAPWSGLVGLALDYRLGHLGSAGHVYPVGST